MNPLSRALLLTATLVVAGACSERGASSAPAPKPAPAFTLPDPAGKKVSLSGYKGQVVLLDFWATWCGPCHDSIPVFQHLHERYGKKGFVVVGVNVDGEEEGVGDFIKKMKMTYQVVLDNDMDVMKAYKVRGIPNMFLIDKEGRIRKHWVGLDDDLETVMDKEVLKLLEEKS